ncbi:MAG: MbnP family protein [Bacteroidota bacterium]
MHKQSLLILSLCTSFLFFSCKKDEKVEDPVVPPTSAPAVAMSFEALMNGKVLKPNVWYVNFYADSFTVRRFNYYISNVKLKRMDGFVFSEPESYHVNKHIDLKEAFTINNVPEGTYTGIEFIIGVDSARNVSGAQTGDLSVEEQMFWEWNSGYIFFKLEGDCRTGDPNKEDFAIHVGGFTGKNNALQKCTFTLADPIVAKNGKKSSVFYQVLMEEIFKNPADLDIETISNGGNAALKSVSDNYRDMFKIARVQN